MAISTIPYALAVDDDPIILTNITDILEDGGFRAHEAEDGDAAMLMLDAHGDNIILIFSDVDMPGRTNGFALARHVAEHYPWIEIVIASGRTTPGPGDMPDKATFISKPFTAQMVHAHLRDMLPNGKKPQPLRTAV